LLWIKALLIADYYDGNDDILYRPTGVNIARGIDHSGRCV